MTGTGAVRDGPRTDLRLSLEGPIPALFCAAGATLTAVGALPWLAVFAGSGRVAWSIRVLAVLALLVGMFVVLVGVGLLRARAAVRTAAAAAILDAELTATAARAHANPSHEACTAPAACASCDASCALNSLRA